MNRPSLMINDTLSQKTGEDIVINRFRLQPSTHKRLFLALTICLVCILSIVSPALALNVNDTLDSVESSFGRFEELVRKTGVVDLKKAAWNDYKVLVKPYFKFNYEFTDNVFKQPSGPSNSDSVWYFTPGVQVVKKFEAGEAGGTYEAAFRYHTKLPEQNTQDQSFLLYSTLFPTDETYVRMSERLQKKGDIAGARGVEPVDNVNNIVNAVMGYAWGDWTFEFGYENLFREFSSTTGNKTYNMDENKFDPRVYWKLNGDSRIYSGARVGVIDFPNRANNDTTYVEVPLGFEGMLPWWNLRALASVGYQHRNLPPRGLDKDFVVTELVLEREFNEKKTKTEVGFRRRPEEGAFSTATTYDEKMWWAEFSHMFSPRLRARLSGFAGNRDWDEDIADTGGGMKNRTDDFIGTDIGFDLRVAKWMIFYIDYKYERRDSNFGSLDYTDNTFSFGTTMPL